MFGFEEGLLGGVSGLSLGRFGCEFGAGVLDVVIAAAKIFLGEAIAMGLRFVEGGLLELPRFVEPALNAAELLEGTTAAARNGECDDDGADDRTDDRADDPAEERKVADEAADDAAGDGDAAEPSGPAASFDEERGELLVLEVEDALLEIV